ncbi:MAG: hypothetical protein ABSF74_01060 [Dehalococcoidia bacterium]|jgi:hypothetical protein
MICTGGPACGADGSAGIFEAVILSAVADAELRFEAGAAPACNDVAALSETDVTGCTGAAWLQAVGRMRIKANSPVAMAGRFTYSISINEL